MVAARGITKRYPGVTALEGVEFEIAPGEIVGLIGENGAGKSTLIKILGGLAQPDAGSVEVDGRSVRIGSAGEATRLGIAVIHQELNDLDNLDVAGNVMLGREPRRGPLIDRRAMRARTAEGLARLGLDLDPDTPQSRLSIGQRQLCEIAKALSQNARLLIMDEPTSSLAAAETARLLDLALELKRQGVAIIYVSHRLHEVQRIADRVVALRDGRNAGELARSQIEPAAMVRLMVGRDLAGAEPHLRELGPEVLAVEDLRTQRFPAHPVSFGVRAGEIVGLAGLVGAGRSEVLRAIFGVDVRVAGAVRLDGRPVAANARAAIARGLFLAPEDRRREGLVTTMSVAENTTLPGLRAFAPRGWLRLRQEAVEAERMASSLRIKTPSVQTAARLLSGGNQQKVVLAKWLSLQPRAILFDEPTRGIDVGARAEIYERIRNLADEGIAIVFASSDMEEVLTLATRILVFHEGKLSGELARENATEEAIMAFATGA